jgi:hypothetical protein
MAIVVMAGCSGKETGQAATQLNGDMWDPPPASAPGPGMHDAGPWANETSVVESMAAAPVGAAAAPVGAAAAPVGAATAPPCAEPTLGFGVALTAEAVDRAEVCHAGLLPCYLGPPDPSEVALSFGSFPLYTTADYFFAVVAAGHEDTGFFDGAEGNLSDNAPSSVEGDRGGGDTLADRTIVVLADQSPKLFPASHGTHAFSFPPSQFMAIHLAPFDLTPSGNYVLVVCPTSATSRCDCWFSAFIAVPRFTDAGTPDPGEAGSLGGGDSGGMKAPDSDDAGGAGGSSADAGTLCNDM